MPDQATDRTGTQYIKTENRTGNKDIEPKTENQTQIKLDQGQIKLDPDAEPPICPTEGVEHRDPPAEGPAATVPQAPQDAEDDEIYYHYSGGLSAEDLEGNLAVLPDIPISTTAKVSIEDLQVGDSGSATPEEIERLRQIIWKKRHLLIGKGNALPPAVKGVVCDIDVGNAKPIALRTRQAPTRFRENVAGPIKGLLTAESIRPSTSPWASPIVIVRKSNGVDIRLCVDYKLVNSLTRMMVYPMLLISDLLEDLDKALCYCSRMPFGLKNAPQIYQRLVDNALYGFLKISRSGDAGATTDVFQTGIADDPDRESVLGRRSYIDDIMIAAESWDQMYRRVEDLLEACDKWNLSISVAKRCWGMDKDIRDIECRWEVWRQARKT
ncbi:LOW QUALITY PROTEIN: reverse transcriptase [Phytophthora megakarya]|uniref:Reverse transcriptase n=1 Tax=Phytophthora megakarya TaxID=4795 RepID=A0A225V1H1_9STRA|nr:LOW QUALITY PROTEIN: reverse transcriptase [Phytophthora megakarya]